MCAQLTSVFNVIDMAKFVAIDEFPHVEPLQENPQFSCALKAIVFILNFISPLSYVALITRMSIGGKTCVAVIKHYCGIFHLHTAKIIFCPSQGFRIQHRNHTELASGNSHYSFPKSSPPWFGIRSLVS